MIRTMVRIAALVALLAVIASNAEPHRAYTPRTHTKLALREFQAARTAARIQCVVYMAEIAWNSERQDDDLVLACATLTNTDGTPDTDLPNTLRAPEVSVDVWMGPL